MPRVLDARTLGRPVHLLPGFAVSLGEDLSLLFQNRLNRRYRASFTVGEVAIRHTDHAGQHPAPPAHWLLFGNPVGRMGVAIDRSLLRAVFDYRYGLSKPQNDAEGAADAAHTLTEERLAASLGQQFAHALANSIERSGGNAPVEEAPVHDFTLQPGSALWPGAWCLYATVRETVHEAEGQLWLALDDAWMARLLQHLAPRGRERARRPRGKQQPLEHALQLTLQARLIRKDIPLGNLLQLRVGDVIPVSLGPTDVLVGDSRLFTAVVAEHKGKLCLTSFEDAE